MGSVVCSLLVLLVVVIILVAFACVIVKLVKRNNTSTNSSTAPPPTSPQNAITQDQSPTLTLSLPPPLPPRPAIRNPDFGIELRTISPQYENPLQLYSTTSFHSKPSDYSIPFVGRILFPNRNSKPSFV